MCLFFVINFFFQLFIEILAPRLYRASENAHARGMRAYDSSNTILVLNFSISISWKYAGASSVTESACHSQVDALDVDRDDLDGSGLWGTKVDTS